MTRSSKRMPKASSRSASWIAVLTQASPCMPIMPRFSGCDAGKAPMPSSVVATGMLVRSANLRTDVAGARDRDAVPGQDHRLLRRVDQVERVLDLAGDAGDAPGGSRGSFGGVGPHELARALLRVLGDVDQHRAGTARARDVEGFAHVVRDVIGAGHQVVVLGDRQRDAGDVGFLEGVGADQLAADLAGDADDRRSSRSSPSRCPVTMLVAPGPDVAMATPTWPVARA